MLMSQRRCPGLVECERGHGTESERDEALYCVYWVANESSCSMFEMSNRVSY